MQSTGKHSTSLLDDQTPPNDEHQREIQQIKYTQRDEPDGSSCRGGNCTRTKIDSNKKRNMHLDRHSKWRKRVTGLCWLISTIQVIFRLEAFMQSLHQAWEKTKQTGKSKDMLSASLIDIWLALGHNGRKVATKERKLSLLRTLRDKLVHRSRMMQYNSMPERCIKILLMKRLLCVRPRARRVEGWPEDHGGIAMGAVRPATTDGPAAGGGSTVWQGFLRWNL